MEGQAWRRSAAGRPSRRVWCGQLDTLPTKTTSSRILKWKACRLTCIGVRTSSPPDGSMHNVRLKRYIKGEEKIGTWAWLCRSVYRIARRWNGLRVLMALIDNWDLKRRKTTPSSTTVRAPASTLSAIWGRVSEPPGAVIRERTPKVTSTPMKKGILIRKTTPESVDFHALPSRPAFIHMAFEMPEYDSASPHGMDRQKYSAGAMRSGSGKFSHGYPRTRSSPAFHGRRVTRRNR